MSSRLSPSTSVEQVCLRKYIQTSGPMASPSCNLLLTRVSKGSPVQVCVHVWNPYPSPDGRGRGWTEGSHSQRVLRLPVASRPLSNSGDGISGNRVAPVGGHLFSASADHHFTFVSLPPSAAHGVLGRAINLIRNARAEKEPSPPAVSSARVPVHKLENGSTGFIH